MRAWEALAPASVRRAGRGHAVRCSWVSGPVLMPTLHTPVLAPTAHSDGRESRRAATNLDVWGGPWGTELQPVCAPPCAPQAVCRAGNSCECGLGYEGDGRTCAGEQGCRGGEPTPLPSPPVTGSNPALPAASSGGPVPGWAWRLQRARQLQPGGHSGHLHLLARLRGRRLELPGPQPL